MIDCPACGHPNIEGSDQCEECQADLFDIGLPETTSEGLAQRLIEDSIMELKPELSLKMFPESTVAEVVQTMIDQQASAAMIVHHDDLVGIFTERDVLNKAVGSAHDPARTAVETVMTADPEALAVDAPICFALNLMSEGGFRHLPLVDEARRPVGILSVKHIVGYLVDLFPKEVLNLPPRPELLHPDQRESG